MIREKLQPVATPHRDCLPDEKVKLQYYTTGNSFEEWRYHLIAYATGKMYHVCSFWCGEKILSEGGLVDIKLSEYSYTKKGNAWIIKKK